MSGPRQYDYIVVGCGGIGSATVYWLARRAGKRTTKLVSIRSYMGHILMQNSAT